MAMRLFPAHFTVLHYVIGIVSAPIATGLLGAYTAYQLMQLESGAAQSVLVRRPIADLYESFGFWPAVLFVPVLGLLFALACAWKLWSIRRTKLTTSPSSS
jgi:uncharacterized membrane protein YjdF